MSPIVACHYHVPISRANTLAVHSTVQWERAFRCPLWRMVYVHAAICLWGSVLNEWGCRRPIPGASSWLERSALRHGHVPEIVRPSSPPGLQLPPARDAGHLEIRARYRSRRPQRCESEALHQASDLHKPIIYSKSIYKPYQHALIIA